MELHLLCHNELPTLLGLAALGPTGVVAGIRYYIKNKCRPGQCAHNHEHTEDDTEDHDDAEQ